MNNLEKYLRFAQNLTDSGRFKNQAAIAEFVGISASQIKKYRTREGLQNIGKFFEFLDKLGVDLSFEGNVAEQEDALQKTSFAEQEVVSLKHRNTQLQRECDELRGQVQAMERMVEKLLAAQSQQGSRPATQGSLLDDLPEKVAG